MLFKITYFGYIWVIVCINEMEHIDKMTFVCLNPFNPNEYIKSEQIHLFNKAFNKAYGLKILIHWFVSNIFE